MFYDCCRSNLSWIWVQPELMVSTLNPQESSVPSVPLRTNPWVKALWTIYQAGTSDLYRCPPLQSTGVSSENMLTFPNKIMTDMNILVRLSLIGQGWMDIFNNTTPSNLTRECVYKRVHICFSHLRNWFTLCLSPKYMYIGYNQLTIEFFSIPLKYSACMHFLNIFFFTCRYMQA